MERGLTPRAVAAAVAVAAIVGALVPYVLLRTGFGPNTSIVSTLLGFSLVSIVGRARRADLHAAQVAGVAAGQTAFMGVALSAFDLLRQRPDLAFRVNPSPPFVFAWLASAGTLGVLIALPLRRHYLDEERLSFPAGEAGAETVLTLARPPAEGPREATPKGRAWAFGLSVATAGGVSLARLARFGVSPLAFGSGMLLAPRLGVSLAVGSGLGAALLPLVGGGGPILPASAMMIAGGVTALALRARALASGLARLSRLRLGGGGFVAAAAALAVLCAASQVALGLSVGLTLASVVVAVPLLLVGTRVLGETNWAPVSALAAVAQAVLSPLVPGCVCVTMVGSSISTAIANGGQHLMQSLRAAEIVRTSVRETAVVQIVGVIVGALALSVSYPMIAAGVLHDGGSPLGAAWAESALVFARGLGALPLAQRGAAAGAALAGVALGLLERRASRWSLSPTAMGVGMLLAPAVAVPIVAGSVASYLGSRVGPKAAALRVPVASGLVAGEAVAAALGALLG